MRQLHSFAQGIGVLFFATIGLVACDKSPVAEFEALKEEVCACSDRACVDALQEKSKSLEGKLQSLSGSDQEKAFAIAEQIMLCTEKIK